MTLITPININSYFPTLQQFRLDCKLDKRLSPSAQLLFRLLVEQANCLRWTDTFICSIDELMEVSHLSKPTVIEARRLLKNLGYIDFKGNPSRYTVYGKLYRQLDQDSPPTPPIEYINTNTKEERKERRKEVPPLDNDLLHHDRSLDRSDPKVPAKADIQAQIASKLKSLGY